MLSHPATRTVSAALAAAAVVASVGLTSGSAAADPESEALSKYQQLTQEAEKLSQEYLKAEEDLRARRSDLDGANNDLGAAQRLQEEAAAQEEQFRGQVDLLTEASFEGARFNQLSALLVSESQQDFLNRMSALGVLAADNDEALGKLSEATAKADRARAGAQDAQGRATEASDAAADLVDEIGRRKADADAQVAEARAQYDSLSASARQTLSQAGDTSEVTPPANASNAAAIALEFALAQRGEPYVFGSNGPDSWDCSSLMQAAYRQAGVSIPRTTYSQAVVGTSVSRGSVQAGDLIIYYAEQSHVAMAIDGTRAVHAATEGVPVKIADIDSIGSVNTIRRVA
ncbi:C40 family peptidase [Umezawaea beigongshangensis]|uniref:C40 family peptidase n=1 Tax=Umezawaea beigongshangensis TaxID=2780383 RepID=UPI0018F1ABCA|nr:C40 family peptidase [Umezawaea beigongshangensis]